MTASAAILLTAIDPALPLAGSAVPAANEAAPDVTLHVRAAVYSSVVAHTDRVQAENSTDVRPSGGLEKTFAPHPLRGENGSIRDGFRMERLVYKNTGDRPASSDAAAARTRHDRTWATLEALGMHRGNGLHGDQNG